MRVTTAALQALRAGFEARYQTAYQSAQSLWPRMATEVPSTTKENTYGWLLRLIRVREWIGPRVLQNLAEASYTIPNRDFEATIAVDRNDIEDDNLGIYNMQFDQLGQAARMYPDDLVLDLLKAGETSPCFDGQNFFDTDHPVSTAKPELGAYSNLFAGKPLTPENYAAVRAAMMSYTGDDGQPLEILPNLLIVPPQLEAEGRKILNAELIGNGETNIWRNSAELLVLPKLADRPGEWYLADTSRPIKPLVFQNRKPPVFVAKDSPQDDNVFFQRQFIYGVEARGAAGYTLPFLMAKAKA